MSTWKKAAKTNQKTHRERHQPASRSHLGLLEKKKDYIERAKQYHQKQKTLKVLQRRALNRNPDEFYFHMINSRVKDGEHHELEMEDEHTPEQIQLMQSQDLKYVVTKRTTESRKIAKLQSRLHMLEAANETKNSHIFFVDSTREAKKFDVVSHLDTHPALMKRRTNRLKKSTLKNLSLPSVDETVLEKALSEKTAAYKLLLKRIEREKQLAIVEQKLALKKHIQNKKAEAPERLQPATKDAPPVYKWKYERKR